MREAKSLPTVSGRRIVIDPAAVSGIEEHTPGSAVLIVDGREIHVKGSYDEWFEWWISEKPQEFQVQFGQKGRKK